MGDEEAEVNLEPLLPTSPTKKVVKSARFQVAQVGDKSKKEEDDNVGPDENGWTHQGSMRSGGDTVQFTQYAKSFRHYLTRDALPAESNYRNLLSFGKSSVKQRPTLEQLREEEIKQNGVSVDKMVKSVSKL